MGLSWSLISIIDARHGMADWCERCGIDLSQATKTGRYPTPNEVRHALDTLNDYQAVYFNIFRRSVIHAIVSSAISSAEAETFSTADIHTKGKIVVNALCNQDDWSTEVNVYDPDDVEIGAEVPHRLYFGKGNLELNIVIAEKISRICGSFLLFKGSYGPYLIPVLVNPGDTDPQQVVSKWDECFRQHGNDLEAWLATSEENNTENFN